MVLRPTLYNRLKLRFGQVRVSKEGLVNVWRVGSGEQGRTRNYFDRAQGDAPGEYYLVSCPYCSDRFFRLSINHAWGMKDKATGSRNLWMAHCHNDNCLEDYQRAKEFYSLVWDYTSPDEVGEVEIVGKRLERQPGRVTWPGVVWPLDKLPELAEARLYLSGRGFDPDWLARTFAVGQLLESQDFHYLTGNYVIPVYFEGRLAGWQARVVGDPPKGEGRRARKYFTMPNMPRQTILYNFDSASRCPFVAVVEGVTDVWRFGPEAVSLLGKPTGGQVHLLASHWKDRQIVILLDPDADKESSDLFAILSRSHRVVKVTLPDDKDPADCDTAWLRGFVGARMREALAAESPRP